MKEEIHLDDLAYNCSDRGELKDKIEAAIHLGDEVFWFADAGWISQHKETVSILSALDLIGEDDLIKHTVNIKHNNTNNDYAAALDEQISNLSEKAAASYEGKFDE